MNADVQTERRSAYLRISGTVTTAVALLAGVLLFAWGLSLTSEGNGPQGWLITRMGVTLFVVGAIGSVLLVVTYVRRRYR